RHGRRRHGLLAFSRTRAPFRGDTTEAPCYRGASARWGFVSALDAGGSPRTDFDLAVRRGHTHRADARGPFDHPDGDGRTPHPIVDPVSVACHLHPRDAEWTNPMRSHRSPRVTVGRHAP